MTTDAKSAAPIAYSMKDAARVTGCSLTRIKRAIRQGELQAHKDGRRTLITHVELQRWVAAMPTIGRKPDQVQAPVVARNGARPTPHESRSSAKSNVLENYRR